MNKILAMQVAATLAAAVIDNLPDNLPIDQDIKDGNVRAENLMTWEIFRIFYHAVIKAEADGENWPPPASEALGGAGDLAAQLIPLVTGNGLFADLLKQLIAAIPTPKPKAQTPTPAPVPNPGS